MLLLPYVHPNDDKADLIIVLEQDNIARMMVHDPATIEPLPLLHGRAIEKITVACVSLEDGEKLRRFSQEGKIKQALQLLFSGYSFRPDLGDGIKPSRLMPKKHRRKK